MAIRNISPGFIETGRRVVTQAPKASALTVYNQAKANSEKLRTNLYGDIEPYVSAAQVAQAKADEFNAAQAEINRNWQMQMSSTAHQREVADLKAAGLNPVISAYGQGASTGSGAQASSTNALTGVFGNMAMSALNAVSSLSQTVLQATTQRANAMTTYDQAVKTTKMQNETQKYITKLNKLTSKEVAHIAGQYGLSTAQIQAFATQNAAQIAAYASMKNAETAANASKFGSQLSYTSSKYTADTTYKNTLANNAMQEYSVDWSTANGIVSSIANLLGTALGSGIHAKASTKAAKISASASNTNAMINANARLNSRR